MFCLGGGAEKGGFLSGISRGASTTNERDGTIEKSLGEGKASWKELKRCCGQSAPGCKTKKNLTSWAKNPTTNRKKGLNARSDNVGRKQSDATRSTCKSAYSRGWGTGEKEPQEVGPAASCEVENTGDISFHIKKKK